MMEVKSINETQDEIIEEFLDFDDWMDRYQLLIDLGSEQEPLADKYKTEQNLIDGCCADCKGHSDIVGASAQRPYPPGDSGCRPLLYRKNWAEGTSLANAQ